jgi:hypothetical protein
MRNPPLTVLVLFLAPAIHCAGEFKQPRANAPEAHKGSNVVPAKLLSFDKTTPKACRDLEPGTFRADFRVGDDGLPTHITVELPAKYPKRWASVEPALEERSKTDA